MHLQIRLKRADEYDVADYVRIARDVQSPINLAITDPREASIEIEEEPVFMIKESEVTVGFASYSMEEVSTAYIYELAVHSNFRGRGIGGEALRLLMKHVMQNEVFALRFMLVTHPDNPAQRLYLRHGFKVADRIDDYERSGTPRLVMMRLPTTMD